MNGLASLSVAAVAVLIHCANGAEKGKLCETRELYQEIPEKPRFYLQCTPKLEHIGEWEEVECPDGNEFVQERQMCVKKDKLMKQSYYYVFRSSRCYTASQFQVGGQCSWATSYIRQDPVSPNYYCQCLPVNNRSPCGTWQRFSCPSNTVFVPQLRICAAQQIQQTCPRNYMPIVGCGAQNYCPGQCTCQRQMCCLRNTYMRSSALRSGVKGLQATCPNGDIPDSTCEMSDQCRDQFLCIRGNCCLQDSPVCPDGREAIRTCSAGSSRTMCPPNYTCMNGGCCLSPLGECANGLRAVSSCNGLGRASCPPGFICRNGLCCRLACSTGRIPTRTCTNNGQCNDGLKCQDGVCC